MNVNFFYSPFVENAVVKVKVLTVWGYVQTTSGIMECHLKNHEKSFPIILSGFVYVIMWHPMLNDPLGCVLLICINV